MSIDLTPGECVDDRTGSIGQSDLDIDLDIDLDTVLVLDTLEYLLGSWQVERVIEDHLTGTRALFSGRVEIGPEHSSYEESSGQMARRAPFLEFGELSVAGHVGAARRSLEYRACGDGTVRVHFPDGRLYLSLDLRRSISEAVHDCGEDRYEISTRVIGPSHVEEHWQVSGPRKDYSATTTWTREQVGDGDRDHGYEASTS